MAPRFSRVRTTVAHTAWTTMRMIARAPVTAWAGFAEAPRAITDMTAVPAVSHARPLVHGGCAVLLLQCGVGLVVHGLQPLGARVLAWELEGQVAEPGTCGGAVPVLDIGAHLDDVAGP